MSATPNSAIFSTNRIESVWGNLNPIRICLDLLARRQLLWQFTRREVQGRYRGSYLGMVWALITPVIMLMVYTFIFHNVFHATWSQTNPNEGFMDYAMNMFSGIIAFNIFSESVGRAPLLIVQNPNFVKKVVFPLEVLPVSLVGSAVVHSWLALVILVVGALTGTGLHWTLVFLPVVFVPLTIFAIGACWLISSLGVFLRDMNNVVAVALSLLFFLTPITYPITRLSLPAQVLMKLNPLASMIRNFRRVVNEGVPPDWASWSISLLIATLAAMIGYAWFMKIKRAFADVL